MRVVFFGTPEFAATVLQAIFSECEIVAIVTRPDTPQGRSQKLQPPAVKQKATEILPHIPLLQPLKCSTPEQIEILKSYDADLFIVVAYGEILSQALLDVPKLGCINLHASLLPYYRGAAPIQRCLMAGEKETGVSIIRMVRKMDAGDVLHMEKMTVPSDMTGGELEQALSVIGSRALIKVIHDFQSDQIVSEEQEHAKATFADKLTTADGHIDWSRPANEIYNRIRALSPTPGAWCEVLFRGQKRRLKILRATLDSQGSITISVPCGDGTLHILQLQLEGKAVMSAADFLRGVDRSLLEFI